MTAPVPVSAADARRVRIAARALARAGLVHAYGHCSLRIDSQHFIVSPPKPLGLVGPDDTPVVVGTEGPLPADALPEVLAHQYIYRQRHDVFGIARFQSPNLTALSTLGLTPKARHGFGAYFAPSAPLHPDPRLVRDSASAGTLLEELGSARAIVMRGNGAVAVGGSIEEAVVMAWYLEDSARVELAVLGTGLDGQILTPTEARDRAVTSGRIVERMWDWLTAGDPEARSAREGLMNDSTLKLKFLSHATLESKDLDFTRRFYEEFLGFEVVKASKISLWCRLGGQHIYVVVQVPAQRKGEMPFLNHNGIDVETEEEVDECHRLVVRDAEVWNLKKITKPAVQHGTYGFYFYDADDNSWEILANPPGGYSWMFDRGDQEGVGHMSKSFERPASTLRRTPKG